jgi:hypothetical protein
MGESVAYVCLSIHTYVPRPNAISKRFELGDRGWAHSLCLLKNVETDLHDDEIIEKSTRMTAF